MCDQVGRKVASFLPQKICETEKRVKIRETAHTQGSVVFHGSRRTRSYPSVRQPAGNPGQVKHKKFEPIPIHLWASQLEGNPGRTGNMKFEPVLIYQWASQQETLDR